MVYCILCTLHVQCYVLQYSVITYYFIFHLDELVAKVLQVIEKLMDVSQQLLDAWSTPELVSAIHEASSLARSS